MSILKSDLKFKSLNELSELIKQIIELFDLKKIKYDIVCNGEYESVGDRLAHRYLINCVIDGIDYMIDGIYDKSYFEEEETEYLLVCFYKNDGNEYLEDIRLESLIK